MGTVPKSDPKRDLDLVKDYLSETDNKWTYSVPQLGVRYARIEDGQLIPLTSSRIYQILNKYGVKKLRGNGRKKVSIKILDK